jgi:hypothetical protein
MTTMVPGYGKQFEEIQATLKMSAAALRDADVPFALGGSLAVWARGGPESCNDLDFVVRETDAERALEALVEDELIERHDSGYRIAEPFLAEWILHYES